MLTSHQKLVLQYISQYVTEHKRNFIEKVLAQRTRYLTVVLEDIYQSQNASAVIRTCECMGIQDVHIVENSNKYSANRNVLKGADKWITLHRYRDKTKNQTQICFQELRNKGYRIIAADPAESNRSVHEMDLSQPVAIIMGNELHGLSPYTCQHCDERVTIPMYGFTGSLNISVSAALCIQSVIRRIHNTDIPVGLSIEEKEALRYDWYKKIVRRSSIIEREFLRTIA